MKRNQAGQHFGFQMNKLADGTNADGLSGIDVQIELDGGGMDTASGGVTFESLGGYKYLFTQAETDAYHIVIVFFHSTAITQRYNIYTDDGLTVEIGKIIKSGEAVNVKQDSVVSEEEVNATTTRI
jgi:hypothetical protein